MRALGIVRKPTIRGFITSASLCIHDIGWAKIKIVSCRRPALCDSAIPPLLQLYLAPPAQLEASAKKSVVKATKHMHAHWATQ